MNKEEFLRQLELLLSGISEEERADAMAFYRSYFEDAGEGNEKAVIEELGSPQKVADNIKKNLGTGTMGAAGYYNSTANRDEEYYRNVNATINNLNQQNKKDNTAAIVVGVVVIILTSPIWIGILAAIFGILVAIIAVMAALIITGLALAGAGIGVAFAASPLVGVALIGAGFIVLAFGILLVVAVVWLFGGFVPWVGKNIVKLCKKLFGKGEERAAL
ncbi:MAG: DUF1700 domain-containing protein [Roseburia sp.]